MRIKLILTLLLLVSTAKLSYSQDDDFPGGSPYTIFGIGDLRYNTALRTSSMGIQGIALEGDYINNMNPAASNKLSFTKFSLSGNYGFLKSSNGIVESKVADGNVDGLNIGIPISPEEGWVLSMGFNPVSSVNYKILSNGSSSGEDFVTAYEGSGGLTRINLGMTYRFFKVANFGLEYNFAFGNIIAQKTINFSNSQLFNTYERTETDLSGSYFNAGLIFSFEDFTTKKNIKHLTFGLFYQSKLSLGANQDGIFQNSITTDTVKITQGDVEIPQRFGFGVSNRFGDRVNVSADVLIQNWEQYQYLGSTPSNFSSSMRVGAGAELLPSPKRDKSFFERLTYRFGFFYDQAYYTINGENVNTMGMALGIGIPFSEYNSLDIGANYSIRGKEENGLIKDEYLDLRIGINFGELWFIRPKDDF